MYFKCDMCYKIIKELETHDYKREGESNGARTTAFIGQPVGLQRINIERYEVYTEFLPPQFF